MKDLLVYPLQTPTAYYLFDANRDQIFETDWEIIDYVEEKTIAISESDRIREEIARLNKQGYLLQGRIKKIRHPYTDEIERKLNGYITSICLQLTQNCNLRCAYCPYSSDGVDARERGHANLRMTEDTAYHAIDFLADHAIYSDSVVIGFYGGEPLLEYQLIKKIVHYAQKKLEGKKINFNFTTNGTLLTREVGDFLAENNVYCMISVDGPEEIHDRNRKYSDENVGSFEILKNNLIDLLERHPQYKEKLSFSTVLDARNGFDDIDALFKTEPFRDIRVDPSTIDTTYINGSEFNISEKYIIENTYRGFLMLLWMMGRLNKKYISPIFYTSRDKFMEKISNWNGMKRLPEVSAPSGPCLPGYNRLFCTVDGTLLPCERVGEKSKIMRIGDIYKGFDYNQISKILNVAESTAEACKSCWAVVHCTQCIKYADGGDKIDASLRLAHCEKTKEEVLHDLRMRLLLREAKSVYHITAEERG